MQNVIIAAAKSTNCHDFRRSRLLSLFGWRSEVYITGFLAIAAPCSHCSICFVFSLHTWFTFPNHTACIYSSVSPSHVFVWNCFITCLVWCARLVFPQGIIFWPVVCILSYICIFVSDFVLIDFYLWLEDFWRSCVCLLCFFQIKVCLITTHCSPAPDFVPVAHNLDRNLHHPWSQQTCTGRV